jgi:hypothetical protein
MMVQRLARPLPTLALFAFAVLLTTLAVVQAIQAGAHPRLLADALTLDLVDEPERFLRSLEQRLEERAS